MKLKDFDFRIWDTENRKYVNENYAKNYHCVGIVKWFENFLGETQDFNKNEFFGFQFFNRHESGCGGFNATEFAEIELWTGMIDKNGKKIYEGDIVKNRDLDTLLCLFDKHNLRFVFKYINRKEYDICYTAMDILEVIGNIHENPKLLKKRKRLDK